MVLKHGALSFTALAAGREGDPVVICLHGFPDNADTFRQQVPVLVDAGFRVIAPTMRGYEPSSQPENNDYTIGTMATDVFAWIDQIGVEKVHLVGHDWGAAVTYAAGALAPERFHSLTTLAVPHIAHITDGVRRVPAQILKSWYMFFFQLRGLSDWALQRNDWALVKRMWDVWGPKGSLSDAEWDNLRATFEAPGVHHAMLAYYRQNASPSVLLGRTNSLARGLTTVPVRTLAMYGADDGCMDGRLYDHLFREEDFPAGFRIERIESAGHFVHLDSPEVVNRQLLEWLGAEA